MRSRNLAEEPRVLDRDDRLCRETLQQCDLLVGERPDLLAINGDRTEKLLLFVQCHVNAATRAMAQECLRSRPTSMLLFLQIRRGNDPFTVNEPICDGSRHGGHRLLQGFDELRRYSRKATR